MRNNAQKLLIVSLLANVVSAVLLVLTSASLIEERSKDKIQLTVSSGEMLPTLRGIQGATGKVMNAYPLDGEEDTAKYWRIEYKK